MAATSINFTKASGATRYSYTFTSDGNERVFQIDFGTEAHDPSEVYVDVKASVSSSMEKVLVSPIEMYGDQNKLFRVDMPSGVIVTLETYLPVSKAMVLVVE